MKNLYNSIENLGGYILDPHEWVKSFEDEFFHQIQQMKKEDRQSSSMPNVRWYTIDGEKIKIEHASTLRLYFRDEMMYSYSPGIQSIPPVNNDLLNYSPLYLRLMTFVINSIVQH